MLKFDNVSFEYSNNSDFRLENISFCVNQGEWITILGNNGSGKSTITKLLCGQYDSYTGNIFYKNNLYNEENYREIIGDISVVFQNPDNQFVGVTVEDDIAFGLENKSVLHEDMESIISKVLGIVDMEEYRTKEPRELSGGQKQRVAIASALAVNPKILVLDEATSMLDPLAREQILKYIKKINIEQNITIISITHDIEELKYSDKILLVNKGKIITEGDSKELYTNKKILEKYNIEVPFLEKLKCDLNFKLGYDFFDFNDNKDRVINRICRLALKK